MAIAETRSTDRQEARKRRKIIIFTVEICVILVMLGVLWLVMKTPSEGPSRVVIDPGNLFINEEVQKKKEEDEESPMLGYMNVALFGVDAKTDKQLYKDSRSDSMMIASINLDTGDIKLVSIYRDTLLDLGDLGVSYNSKKEKNIIDNKTPEDLSDDIFQKCNAAYSYGGAEQALKMLNMNLDMDIETFVTVGYKGLSKVVDGLGGVWLDVDETELLHINNYQMDVAKVLKCEYTPVTITGYQKLDGLQATAYCRIRYGGGGDFKRTSRQREVLKAIEKEAKNTDLATLTKIFVSCMDEKIIYTNISNEQILKLLGNIAKYSIVEEGGFPNEDKRVVKNIDQLRGNLIGSSVISDSLEENVAWLHQFLFGDEDYAVTDRVKEISKTIADETAKYVNSN